MAKEGESSVQVVKVCPTVEELRLKPSTNATRLLCPVAGCKSFPFKSQRSLTYHINALHPHLSKYHNPDKVTSWFSIWGQFVMQLLIWNCSEWKCWTWRILVILHTCLYIFVYACMFVFMFDVCVCECILYACVYEFGLLLLFEFVLG